MTILLLGLLGTSHLLATVPFWRKIQAGTMPGTVDFATLSILLYYDVGILCKYLLPNLDYLRTHPKVDLVGARVIVFDNAGSALGKRDCAETHEAICARASAAFPLVHPTFIGRIEFFRQYLYRASAVRCEDQDLLLRSYSGTQPPLFARGMLKSQDQDLLVRSFKTARFANVPEILLGYRESRLDWRKNLMSRRYLAISFFQNHWKVGHRFLAVRALLGQVFKSLVDLIAIGTGLDYRVLRHRARPTTAPERQRWQQVWSELNRTPAPAPAPAPARRDDRCLAS
jgi:hypothetical protein